MADYIPSSDGNFNIWQANFVTYATANSAALGLSAGQVTILTTPQAPWSNALSAHVAAQDAADGAVVVKDTSRDTFEAAIRQIVRYIQARAATTDLQRGALGITIPSGPGPAAPAPSSRPVVSADTSERFRIRLAWTDLASGNKAKPDGVMGAEIYMKVGGAPPVDETECNFVALDTATPYTVEFAGADANKTAYFMARWVSTRGQKGAFSETVAATVTG